MTHRLEGPSMTVLDKLRDAIDPDLRGYLHGLTPVLMTALVAFGATTDTVAALIAGAAIACLDLLFALLHSTNTWRSALYGFGAAMQPIGIAIGWGANHQWVAALAVLSALLGSGIAAGKTPSFKV